MKMEFITDKQTLDDLNILGRYKSNSIYSLFNQTNTSGGAKLMDAMFHQPLLDADAVNRRSEIFHYFQHKDIDFPLDSGLFQEMENYLNTDSRGSLLTAVINMTRIKFLTYLGLNKEYDLLFSGLQATITSLNLLNDFISRFDEAGEHPYSGQIRVIKNILIDSRLNWLAIERNIQSISFLKLARFDYLFRCVLKSAMKILSVCIYNLDVYITVSNVARANDFSYAVALPQQNNIIDIHDFKHPRIVNAVANSISTDENGNVIFLTGANMAGKSTLMKSFGIAIYLAHMGFPIAAKEMRFSIRDGIYTSINVPDSLNMGYSHFYAEVLRVKKVAEDVSDSKNLVVIFDELFKGTNVKDAYDATLAVTSAFAQNRNCSFIISTHIIEVGEILRQQRNIRFFYLPTKMEGISPIYTYKLEAGITNDRHGMMIIENEGILEILSANQII